MPNAPTSPAARRATAVARLALLVSAGACATGRSGDFPPDAQARAAVDVPAQFTLAAPPEAVQGGDAVPCANPAVDPRDGTRLVLVRSRSGRGDYEAPAGKYGVGAAELLRLDCATGRAIGVVARGQE